MENIKLFNELFGFGNKKVDSDLPPVGTFFYLKKEYVTDSHLKCTITDIPTLNLHDKVQFLKPDKVDPNKWIMQTYTLGKLKIKVDKNDLFLITPYLDIYNYIYNDIEYNFKYQNLIKYRYYRSGLTDFHCDIRYILRKNDESKPIEFKLIYEYDSASYDEGGLLYADIIVFYSGGYSFGDINSQYSRLRDKIQYKTFGGVDNEKIKNLMDLIYDKKKGHSAMYDGNKDNQSLPKENNKNYWSDYKSHT